MELNELIQVIVNNGLALGVAVYFLVKDWKQSTERIDADKLLSESLVKQSEVLRQLNDTVSSLKDVIMKSKED